MLEKDRYILYHYSNNRVIAYDKIEKRNISYPRIIMEDYLNRKLLRSEEVHHKDGNPLNNDVSNLEVLDGKEHQRMHGYLTNKNRKYYDKVMVCPVCKKDFIWTAKQQRCYYVNKHTSEKKGKQKYGPFCSNECSGRYNIFYQRPKTRKHNQTIEDKILVNLIYETVILTKGNMAEASRKLNISKSTIRYKLKAAGLPYISSAY